MADPVWIMAMFDLPTVTAEEKRAATAFRHLLEDNAFHRVQWSVYARYLHNAVSAVPLVTRLRTNLPDRGALCVLRLTDAQWATADRYIGRAKQLREGNVPTQLVLFDSLDAQGTPT